MVSCRICKGDHWTTKCPYKDTLGPIQEKLQDGDKPAGEAGAVPTPAIPGAPAQANKAGGKYVPPSLRDGPSKGKGETMQSKRGKIIRVVSDYDCTIADNIFLGAS